MKYLLEEDDCAPDAREFFIAKLKEKFGLDFDDMKKNAVKIQPDDLTIEYHYKGFVLSYAADDPYYKLIKINNSDRF